MGTIIESAGIYRITTSLEAVQAKRPVTYKIIAKRPSGDARLIKVGDIYPGGKTDLEANVYLEPGDSFYVTMHTHDSGAAYLTLTAIDVKAIKARGWQFDRWGWPDRFMTNGRLRVLAT
jgi:hypothetical protein